LKTFFTIQSFFNTIFTRALDLHLSLFFTEEWRYITREERDVYEDQEMLATKTTYLPVMYFYFRHSI
jgi:hypothetical protein